MYKRLVSILMLLVGFITLTATTGCSQEQSRPAVLERGAKYDIANFGSGLNMRAVITEGNHSYIPINISLGGNYSTSSYASQILRLLNAFEQDHPELKVTSWKLEVGHQSHGKNDVVHGIWVDHGPRATSLSLGGGAPEPEPTLPRPSVFRF